jgi:hypothetical protein
LAEAIFRRSSLRERRPSKWKASHGTGLRSLFGRLEVAAAFSVALVLAISLMSYFALLTLLAGTAAPFFVRFVLAESISMILAAALVIVATRII